MLSPRLENISNDIRSGKYRNLPEQLGNLTLQIGQIVDEDVNNHVLAQEKTTIVLDALKILTDMFNQDETHDLIFGIQGALTHKIEYLIRRYREIIPEQILHSYDDLLQHIKTLDKDMVKTLSGLDPDDMVNVLQLIITMDEQGKRSGHYEVVSLPVSEILRHGGTPKESNIVPPIRTNGNGGNNPPPPPSSGSFSPPPPPPEQAHAAPGGPNDPTNKYQTPITIDIAILVFTALLRSVIQDVEPVTDGVKLLIKPDVLKRTFDRYIFETAYDGNTWEAKHFETLGGTNVDGLAYVRQILLAIGYRPQVASFQSLVVPCSKISMLYHINDDAILNLMYHQITPLQNRALTLLKRSASTLDTKYTAFDAHDFWQKFGNDSPFVMYVDAKGKGL